jgi:hypothetical protein
MARTQSASRTILNDMTLWASDRETVWALNAGLLYRNRVPQIGVHWHAYGRTVIVSAPKKAYGRSTRKHASVTHLTDRVYIAWRNGKCMGYQIRWACGNRTTSFVMTECETPSYPMCKTCECVRDHQRGCNNVVSS